jgi:molybdopterin-guanine dinucleotide biosynthesis protein A
MRCAGAILAGGEARRFGGRPKGLERVGGIRIIDRVARALAAAVDAPLLLVANEPAAASWLPDARVVPDAFAGRGPLVALHAALHHAASDVLVVAWDMPFVTPALLRLLRDRGEGAAAAVVEREGGVEPLCAFYARACAPVAERLLGEGERRAEALADAVAAVRIPRHELTPLGDPDVLLFGVNDPAALADAQRIRHGG